METTQSPQMDPLILVGSILFLTIVTATVLLALHIHKKNSSKEI